MTSKAWLSADAVAALQHETAGPHEQLRKQRHRADGAGARQEAVCVQHPAAVPQAAQHAPVQRAKRFILLVNGSFRRQPRRALADTIHRTVVGYRAPRATQMGGYRALCVQLHLLFAIEELEQRGRGQVY